MSWIGWQDDEHPLTRDELLVSFRAACPFDVEDADFERIWAALDRDNDGEITIDEFVDSIIHKQYNVEGLAASIGSAKSASKNCGKRRERRADQLAFISAKSKGYQPANVPPQLPTPKGRAATAPGFS